MTIITNTPPPSKPPNRAFFDEEPSKQKNNYCTFKNNSDYTYQKCVPLLMAKQRYLMMNILSMMLLMILVKLEYFGIVTLSLVMEYMV